MENNHLRLQGFSFNQIKKIELYRTHVKLITYSTRGENDTEILVSQLNSYKEDMPIDGLVLEMNFTFETNYERTSHSSFRR